MHGRGPEPPSYTISRSPAAATSGRAVSALCTRSSNLALRASAWLNAARSLSAKADLGGLCGAAISRGESSRQTVLLLGAQADYLSPALCRTGLARGGTEHFTLESFAG